MCSCLKLSSKGTFSNLGISHPMTAHKCHVTWPCHQAKGMPFLWSHSISQLSLSHPWDLYSRMHKRDRKVWSLSITSKSPVSKSPSQEVSFHPLLPWALIISYVAESFIYGELTVKIIQENTAHSSAGAAITQDHRLGGLNKRHILSHCFRDQKSVIRQSHTSSNTREGSVPSFSPWLSESQVLPVSFYHLLFIRTLSHWINDPP